MAKTAKKVEIYTTKLCGHCYAAKSLLKRKGVEFEEIDVTFNSKKRAEMEDRAKRYTVPQVFIDGQSIGGARELHALEGAGKLDELLGRK